MDRSSGVQRQFGLRALFGVTALCAAVFAIFRWLGLEPRTSLFVAAVLGTALAGAFSLVVAIGRYGMEDGERGQAANGEARDDETNDT
ncbi:MAG TPA: hypothetical protein VG125_30295 [Pirellulales bacterium]|jgi:predicted outer membrane lipoprotein|nr:hypothetical protein [Pirellulales bacterium]